MSGSVLEPMNLGDIPGCALNIPRLSRKIFLAPGAFLQAFCAADLSPASPETHWFSHSALQMHRRLPLSLVSESH